MHYALPDLGWIVEISGLIIMIITGSYIALF